MSNAIAGYSLAGFNNLLRSAIARDLDFSLAKVSETLQLEPDFFIFLRGIKALFCKSCKTILNPRETSIRSHIYVSSI